MRKAYDSVSAIQTMGPNAASAPRPWDPREENPMPDDQSESQSSDRTATPPEPPVTIPPITSVDQLQPDLPTVPEDKLKEKPVPAAAYQVATVTADQAFATAFDKAKADLVKAQGAYTAAQQTYALAVATYNNALQTAYATKETGYSDAKATFEKSC